MGAASGAATSLAAFGFGFMTIAQAPMNQAANGPYQPSRNRNQQQKRRGRKGDLLQHLRSNLFQEVVVAALDR